MTRDYVLGILNDLSPNDPHVVVAGSAAICPERAADVDVWVFNESPLDNDALIAAGCWEDIGSYDDMDIQVLQRLEADHTWDQRVKIQVMFLKEGMTLDKLLDQFDLSCHQWALLHDGTQVRGDRATRPGEKIVIKPSLQRTWANQSRRIRMEERYRDLSISTDSK